MARWAATGMTILLACATWSETIATPGWVVSRNDSREKALLDARLQRLREAAETTGGTGR